jgi:hypothetical protein
MSSANAWCALSLNPPTLLKRLEDQFRNPMQRDSPQVSNLERDHSTPRLPFTEKTLRVPVAIISITAKASLMSAPRNLLPTPAPPNRLSRACP